MKADRQGGSAAGAGVVRRAGRAGGRRWPTILLPSCMPMAGWLGLERGRGGATRRPGLHPSGRGRSLRSALMSESPAVVCRPSRCRGGCGKPWPSSGWASSSPIVTRSVWSSLSALFLLLLVSLFLSLAIEPGVNRLAARGWRRGTATAVILVGVFLGFIIFVVAIGTLVGQQIADLLGNSEKYVNRTVDFINDTFDTNIDADGGDRGDQRPERCGAEVHPQPAGQGRRPVGHRARRAAAGVVGAAVHLLPRGRRPEAAPRDLQPAAPRSPATGARADGSWRSTRPAATCTRGRCSPGCRRSSTGCCSRRSASRRRSRWRCGSA